MYRVGLGVDIHPFEEGRTLMLGGVNIESDMGLKGHSDGDVVLHALADALLGAAALGDIGEHFPGDAKNKNRPSREILEETIRKIWDRGYQVVNVDIMVMAEKPKLAPYRDQMREVIAKVLNIELYDVGVKATTAERLGSIGRSEGIYCQAIALIKKSEEVS